MMAAKKKTAKPAAEPVAEVITADESTAVVVVEIPKESALAVFTADNGLNPYIEKIRAECEAFIADTSTKKGRDEIASMAYKVVRSKTYLDNAGKNLVAELKAIPAKIDAERKRMRETLDALRDKVREPLTAWELAEEQRIANHKTALAELEALLVVWDVDSVELARRLDFARGLVVDESWDEFLDQAQAARERAVIVLEPALAKRKAYEAEQAELTELRRQAEERAEAEARAEREAAERRERELIEAAERAEREAEAARQQAEQAEKERLESEARERDIENQRRVNVAAFQDFVNGGIPNDYARLAVTLIAKKAVRGVVINY